MVDWKSPEIVEYSFFLYEQIAVFLLGLYGAYVLTTVHVEWQLVTRKRAFRAVHVPFLLARYIALAALLFFVITTRTKTRFACDFAYRAFATLGSLAAMLASMTLGFRPAAIFYTMKLHFPLGALLLMAVMQLVSVVLQGVYTLHATWAAGISACIVYQWDSTVLVVFYAYTFIFDVVILLLTLYAVRCVHQEQKWGMGDILCIQGIWYAFVTCIVNVPVVIMGLLDLNPGMDVLLSLPAMTISVIASSHTLLSLEDYGASSKSQTGEAASRSAGCMSTQWETATTRVSVVMSAMSSDEVNDEDLEVANTCAKTSSQASTHVPTSDGYGDVKPPQVS